MLRGLSDRFQIKDLNIFNKYSLLLFLQKNKQNLCGRKFWSKTFLASSETTGVSLRNKLRNKVIRQKPMLRTESME